MSRAKVVPRLAKGLVLKGVESFAGGIKTETRTFVANKKRVARR